MWSWCQILTHFIAVAHLTFQTFLIQLYAPLLLGASALVTQLLLLSMVPHGFLHPKNLQTIDIKTAVVIINTVLCSSQDSHSQYTHSEHSFNTLSPIWLYCTQLEKSNGLWVSVWAWFLSSFLCYYMRVCLFIYLFSLPLFTCSLEI